MGGGVSKRMFFENPRVPQEAVICWQVVGGPSLRTWT